MKRLVDELAPSARRDLLSSAERDERAPPEARARALAAGLEALGATAAPEPGRGAGTPTVAKGVGKALVAGILALGGLALVLAVVARGTTTSTTSPASTNDTPPASAPRPSPSPTPPAPEALSSTPPAPPVELPRSAPSSSAPAVGPRVRPSSDAPAGDQDDVLAREVRAIGAARAAHHDGCVADHRAHRDRGARALRSIQHGLRHRRLRRRLTARRASLRAHPARRRRWSACTPDANRCVDRSSSCRRLDTPWNNVGPRPLMTG